MHCSAGNVPARRARAGGGVWVTSVPAARDASGRNDGARGLWPQLVTCQVTPTISRCYPPLAAQQEPIEDVLATTRHVAARVAPFKATVRTVTAGVRGICLCSAASAGRRDSQGAPAAVTHTAEHVLPVGVRTDRR